MNIPKLFFISACIAGTFITSSLINLANAKEIEIYRWVDHNNVVHFSQNLPRGNNYTELSTVSSYSALSTAERKALADSSATEESDPEDSQDVVIEANKAIYEKNCKTARLNIQMLNSLNVVHVSEAKADGSISSRPLTAEERTDKLALSKKHEEIYCTK